MLLCIIIPCIALIYYVYLIDKKTFPQKIWSQARSMLLFDNNREFYLLNVITYVNNISIM